MKNKTHAIPGAAPTDRRSPLPLSQEEMATASKARNDFERAKIHRALLIESMRRLRSGRTLEREHGVIHPEMTCIVRDVLRLTDLVFPGSAPPAECEQPANPLELSAAAQALSRQVARHGHVKIARRVGMEPRLVKAWAAGQGLPDDAQRTTIEARLKIPAGDWGTP
jgi:hypothetical protein